MTLPAAVRTPVLRDDLLCEKEVAAELKISVKTLQEWRSRRKGGPDFLRFGRTIRYRRSDLAAFVRASIVRPMDDR